MVPLTGAKEQLFRFYAIKIIYSFRVEQSQLAWLLWAWQIDLGGTERGAASVMEPRAQENILLPLPRLLLSWQIIVHN